MPKTSSISVGKAVVQQLIADRGEGFTMIPEVELFFTKSP